MHHGPCKAITAEGKHNTQYHFLPPPSHTSGHTSGYTVCVCVAPTGLGLAYARAEVCVQGPQLRLLNAPAGITAQGGQALLQLRDTHVAAASGLSMGRAGGWGTS